jgi:hypothetical protein
MNMPIAALPPNPMSVENAKVENNSFQYTSLQEMEQFTLPIAYQPSPAYAPIPFLSATASSIQTFEGSFINFILPTNGRPTVWRREQTFTS